MNCLKFNMPTSISVNEVRSAKLWLYKKKTVRSGNAGSYKTAVYSVKENTGRKSNDEDVYDSSPVDRNSEKWIQIDITMKVLSWISKRSRRGHRLDVLCPTCWRKRNGDAITRRSDKFRPIIETTMDKAPLIVIDVGKKKESRRKKRSTCSRGGCCKEDFILDFKKIGWSDWIIVPYKVNIRQCQGTCSS